MRVLCVVSLAALVGACNHHPDRLPDPCEGADVCNQGVPPNTSGGGGDGGGMDAAVDGDGGPVVVTLEGEMVVAQAVPVPAEATGTRIGAFWQIAALTPEVPGTSVMTDSMGAFTLEGVRVMPETRSVIVRATPPPGEGPFGVLNEFRETGARLELFGPSSTAFETAALSAGVAAGTNQAHVVFAISGAATSRTGVSVRVTDGSSVTIAYDDSRGGLSASVAATSDRGTIALFNINAPVAGRRVPVTFSRGGRNASFNVFVMPGQVTFAQVAAP